MATVSWSFRLVKVRIRPKSVMCPTDVKSDSPITLVFLPRFKSGTSPEEEQAGAPLLLYNS